MAKGCFKMFADDRIMCHLRGPGLCSRDRSAVTVQTALVCVGREVSTLSHANSCALALTIFAGSFLTFNRAHRLALTINISAIATSKSSPVSACGCSHLHFSCSRTYYNLLIINRKYGNGYDNYILSFR